MSPTERRRLAEALTAATGHEWRATDHDVERVATDDLPPISIDVHQRQHSVAICDGYGSEFIEIIRHGYTGRGWMGRMVADIVPLLDKAASFRPYRERELLAALGHGWTAPARRTPNERAFCEATGVMVTYVHRERAVYVQIPGGELVKAGDFRDSFGPGYWRVVANAVANAVRMLMPAPPTPRRTSERDRRRATTYRNILRPDSGAAESERAQARAHLERMGAT